MKIPEINCLKTFAKKNHMGYGFLKLRNGGEVNIISNPTTELFHILSVKDGHIVKAEGGRGVLAMKNAINKYEPDVSMHSSMWSAFEHSFHVIV